MKLEYGKRYVRRDGEVTGPLQKNPSRDYPFNDDANANSYSKTGDYNLDDGEDCPFDLVSEYETPVPPTPPSANSIQPGGTHYIQQTIQPWDYIIANNLGFLEGNAIKYITRHRSKNGIEDIDKAIHYLIKLKETLQ